MDIHKSMAINSKGFTLIELMVTLAVLGILMAIAYPSLTTTIANSRVSSQSKNIRAILDFARSEAITRGERVTVFPSSNWQGNTTIVVDGNTIKNLPAFDSKTVITPSPATTLSFNSMGLYTGSNISIKHKNASFKSDLGIGSGGTISLTKTPCTTSCVTAE